MVAAELVIARVRRKTESLLVMLRSEKFAIIEGNLRTQRGSAHSGSVVLGLQMADTDVADVT
jgi:hypothetical protein